MFAQATINILTAPARYIQNKRKAVVIPLDEPTTIYYDRSFIAASRCELIDNLQYAIDAKLWEEWAIRNIYGNIVNVWTFDGKIFVNGVKFDIPFYAVKYVDCI